MIYDFVRELVVNPKERSIIICENLLMPKTYLEILASILF